MDETYLKPISPRFKDLLGQTFHWLKVIKYLGSNEDGRSVWRCLCKCGTIKDLLGTRLTQTKEPVKSCGCWQREAAARASIKRGEELRKSPTYYKKDTRMYKLWVNIRQRCNNPKTRDYEIYGKRGITIAPQWDNFLQFSSDVGEPPSPQHSLDRIDNNGPYSPDNVRWSLPIEQANNRRTNKWITFQNETHTMSQWSRILGISKSTLSSRLRRGQSVEQMLTTPVK